MLLIEAVGLSDMEKVIAVMGAGGKTTFLFQMGRELKDGGSHVLLTTTTQMFMPGEVEVDKSIILSREHNGESSSEKFLTTYPVKTDKKLVFLASRHLKENKVKGISPDLVEKLKGADIFHRVLVEADGSRRKPIKSYESHEPNLPDCSDLVVVMAGANALGKPLTEKHIHRAFLAAQYLESPPGSAVGIEYFARLMEQGAEKARAQAGNARIIAFINQVDQKSQAQKILPLIHRLFKNNFFDRVIVGSCRNPNLNLEIFCQ